MTIKMRHCCNCGEELGMIASKYYDRWDTCGKLECNRSVRDAFAEERAEAHEQLDRDMGWN